MKRSNHPHVYLNDPFFSTKKITLTSPSRNATQMNIKQPQKILSTPESQNEAETISTSHFSTQTNVSKKNFKEKNAHQSSLGQGKSSSSWSSSSKANALKSGIHCGKPVIATRGTTRSISIFLACLNVEEAVELCFLVCCYIVI